MTASINLNTTPPDATKVTTNVVATGGSTVSIQEHVSIPPTDTQSDKRTTLLDVQLMQRSLWADMPDLTITYKDLSYIIPVAVTDQDQVPTLASSLMDSLLLRSWTQPRTDFAALQPNSGFVRPGEMTLILAPPGHGKSTFLQALAGRYHNDPKLGGEILYNGLTYQQQQARGIHINRMTGFVNQGEAHNALLTVRETLAFALNNAVANPSLVANEHFQLLSSQKVDLVLELLGLMEAQHTVLGNAMVRGVSGGQKRRVTLGEMMITDARALFLDEITTGLDSSVSYDILNATKEWSHLARGSVVAALLQPTPECFALFDRLVLMRHGAIIYDGPVTGVVAYLHSIGVPVPDDQDLADFLSDFVTDPAMVYYRTVYRAARKAGSLPSSLPTLSAGIQVTNDPHTAKEPAVVAVDMDTQSANIIDSPEVVTADISKPNDILDLARFIAPPLTTSSLKAAFMNTCYYSDISVFVDKSKLTAQRMTPTSSPYTRAQYGSSHAHTFWHHGELNLANSFQTLRRSVTLFLPRIIQAVILGLLLGGIFYQVPVDNYQARFGLLAFVLNHLGFTNAAEIPFAAEGKNVVFKQVDAGFYPTVTYAFGAILTQLPVSLAEVTVLGSILYFMSDFTADAGRFFFFLLVLWLVTIAMGAVVRLVTWGTRHEDIANQLSVPIIATLFISSGYLVIYNNFPRWLLGLYEVSPFTWGLRSLGINEFYADRYSESSNVPGYDGMTQGEAYLRLATIDPTWSYKWSGVGYLIGFFLVIACASSVVLSVVRYPLTVGTKRFEQEDENQMQVIDIKGSNLPSQIPPALGDIKQLERTLATARGYLSSFNLPSSSTALPFIPVDLAWKGIDYTVMVDVDGKNVPRMLLSGIDGFAQSGTLTALMGSSGAGKTTLMDVIAGRKTSGIINGEIYVNGYAKVTRTFNRLVGYVEQTDNHLGTQTVREALEFSAKLRLPRSVTDVQRKTFIDEILNILELLPIANRMIGDSASIGLSPGQLKRVTIGVELAANPSVLFLDEPTSGLDSRAALIVMRVVKRIAQTGRSVLCTIHQPSAELFALFDRLLLLKSGGQTVYFGDVGDDGAAIVQYFETTPMPAGMRSPRKPSKTNPASWMLTVIGAGTGAGANIHNTIVDYQSLYSESELKRTNSDVLNLILTPKPGTPELRFDHVYAATWLTQAIELQRRVFQSYWRNTTYLWVRHFTMLFLSCLLGFLYFRLTDSDAHSVTSRIQAEFVGAVFPSWTMMMSAIPMVMRWRTVYYREQASFMYHHSAYTLALTVVEVVYTSFATIVFLSCFYSMVGFNNSGTAFFRYYLVEYLLMLLFLFTGQLIASGTPNIQVANIVASFLGTFAVLFSGVFKLAGQMPIGWKWIYYIFPIPKALTAMTTTALDCGDDCTLLYDQTGPDGKSWGNINSFDYALRYLDSSPGYGQWIGWLVLSIVVVRIFFVIVVAKVNFMKR